MSTFEKDPPKKHIKGTKESVYPYQLLQYYLLVNWKQKKDTDSSKMFSPPCKITNHTSSDLVFTQMKIT